MAFWFCVLREPLGLGTASQIWSFCWGHSLWACLCLICGLYMLRRDECVITCLFWHIDVSGSAAFCSLTDRELYWLRWYSWNSGPVMFVTPWLTTTLRSVSDECVAKLPVSEVKFSRKSKKVQWFTLSRGSWADETWRALPSAELGLQPQFRILSGLRIWWAHLRSASCPPFFLLLF